MSTPEAAPASQLAPLPRSPKGPQGFKWWYESIIDAMILGPEKTKAEIAKELGVSVHYLYQITSSDVFQARYAERRAELNTHIAEEITNRLGGLALRGLDIIKERMDNQEASKLPLEEVQSATDMALRSLGYGVKQPGAGVNVQINQQIPTGASPEILHTARHRIRSQQVEGQSTSVGPREPYPEPPTEIREPGPDDDFDPDMPVPQFPPGAEDADATAANLPPYPATPIDADIDPLLLLDRLVDPSLRPPDGETE